MLAKAVPVRLRALMREALDMPYHFRAEYLRNKRWAAVPVESGLHFTEEDAMLIARAARDLGCHTMYAVPTEDLKQVAVSEVSADTEDLMNFSHEYGHFNSVLISPIESFMILCCVEDYYIIAGPGDFVVSALGKSIPVARAEFLESMANGAWYPEKLRQFYTEVAGRYESFNG